MNRKRRLMIKYLLLISVLMLMMLLCACRVRLTNNTEVASTIEDEDGWLKDSYQMRRDQLGEPVAERPIFRGMGSDDEEDYSDLDYEPLDYDQGTLDEWDEPEDTSSSSPGSSGGSSGRGSGSSSGSGSGSGSESSEEESTPKEEEKPKPDPVIEIIVELDVNGGNPIDPSYIKAVTGQTYRSLPGGEALTHPDKSLFFSGWFTEKEGGSLITAESTVESEEPLTLYAHWGKNYTFTLDTDGGLIDPKEVQKTSVKGLYPALPVPKKDGFHFMGWYVKDGDKEAEVREGSECKSNQSPKAHWLENAKYWEKVYNDTNPAEENKVFFITDDNNTTGKLVRGTPWDASSPDSSPAFVIIRLADGTYSPDAAKNAAAQKRAENEKYADSKIIVIPKNATDGSNELYYKLVLHNAMYGGIEGIDTAAAETGAAISDYAVDPDKAAPAQ